MELTKVAYVIRDRKATITKKAISNVFVDRMELSPTPVPMELAPSISMADDFKQIAQEKK